MRWLCIAMFATVPVLLAIVFLPAFWPFLRPSPDRDEVRCVATSAAGWIAFESVVGNVGASTDLSAPGGSAVLNETCTPAVGQLTVSGTAPDKRTVAAYADELATVKGLAAPLVSTVQVQQHGVTFTVTAVSTSDALGGRYAAPTTSPTGGH